MSEDIAGTLFSEHMQRVLQKWKQRNPALHSLEQLHSALAGMVASLWHQLPKEASNGKSRECLCMLLGIASFCLIGVHDLGYWRLLQDDSAREGNGDE